jgi:hypothetical protein
LYACGFTREEIRVCPSGPEAGAADRGHDRRHPLTAMNATKKPNTWLLDFVHDVYSQTGEDGVIGKILDILPENDGWCVEFGAWDGRHLSNTRNLIESRGYSAVLIEGSEAKYEELRRNYAGQEKVFPVNQFVGFEGGNSLDRILAKTPIPKDFDFLSIDIDGNDYHVWKALTEYRPKVVCVEFNPTIPTEVNFVQEPDPAINQGCSATALYELGKSKGYELVSLLGFNTVFVRSEYFPLFEIEDNSPQALRTSNEAVTYIFSGYDGTLFLRGHRRLPWHNVELDEAKIQHLPKYLRTYPSNFSKLQSALLRLIANPLGFPGEVVRRLKKDRSGSA